MKEFVRRAAHLSLLVGFACSTNPPPSSTPSATTLSTEPSPPKARAADTSSSGDQAASATTGANSGSAAGGSEASGSAGSSNSPGSSSAANTTGTTGTTGLDPDLNSGREPDVVFVPTPQPIVDKMLDLAKVQKGDVLYDLGCGDGRIVVTAAKRYGIKARGFDIDPKRVMEARENVRQNNVQDLVTIEQKDIFTLDLSPASVVTLYLLPQLNVKLIPQLQKLKPGARIVSHDFDMEGVTPIQHLKLQPKDVQREHEIFFWRAPIKVSSTAK